LSSHKEKGRVDLPAKSNSPTRYREDLLMVSINHKDQERTPELAPHKQEKRGGAGPAAKQTPDPRTTHSPKAIVQVVCKW